MRRLPGLEGPDSWPRGRKSVDAEGNCSGGGIAVNDDQQGVSRPQRFRKGNDCFSERNDSRRRSFEQADLARQSGRGWACAGSSSSVSNGGPLRHPTHSYRRLGRYNRFCESDTCFRLGSTFSGPVPTAGARLVVLEPGASPPCSRDLEADRRVTTPDKTWLLG